MPGFKEFIKGFEEKPEAKNPNPAPTPKPQEVKMEEPKVEENEFSKSRPAFTHDFAESLRKDAINWANEKMPYDKSLPKILNNYTRDEVIDFMRGNIGEDEIMKRAKERNGVNQDRVNLLAKQEAPKAQEDKTKVTKGIVDFDNKQDFLEKNNWAKDFSWQGNDLIDRKTNEKVYTLSKEGAQVPVIADEIIKHKGKQSQPKQGSFEQTFGENAAPEYNTEDYQNAAPNREAAQKLGNAKPTDFSPYVFDTDQGRFSIVNDEQARKDGAEMIKAYFQDEQGFDTFPAEIARDLKAKFGDPSQDEDLEINYQTVADYFIDKYGYSRMLTPHTGKVIDLGNGYKAYQITEKQGD